MSLPGQTIRASALVLAIVAIMLATVAQARGSHGGGGHHGGGGRATPAHHAAAVHHAAAAHRAAAPHHVAAPHFAAPHPAVAMHRPAVMPRLGSAPAGNFARGSIGSPGIALRNPPARSTNLTYNSATTGGAANPFINRNLAYNTTNFIRPGARNNYVGPIIYGSGYGYGNRGYGYGNINPQYTLVYMPGYGWVLVPIQYFRGY
jgi:hypothetical protein